jgi:hypothetical protein
MKNELSITHYGNFISWRNCCQCAASIVLSSLAFSPSISVVKMKKVFYRTFILRLFVSTLHPSTDFIVIKGEREMRGEENLSFQHSMWPLSSASFQASLYSLRNL